MSQNPDVRAHVQVVRLVVSSLRNLAYLLYVLVGVLLILEREVPGELWGAAAGVTGVLGGMLINTKSGTAAAPATATVEKAEVRVEGESAVSLRDAVTLDGGDALPPGADVGVDEYLDDSVPEVETDAPAPARRR